MTWKTPGKTLDMKLGEVGVAVSHDGVIALTRGDNGHWLCSMTILELVYIIQQYQQHGGVIVAAINSQDWRGVEGKP